MRQHSGPATRFTCPCCGYPTLDAPGDYDICSLCNWEDDGQGDADADDVRGGPNAGYSLSEARANFKKYRVMYVPYRDQRLGGGDSPQAFETKGQLMSAFEQARSASRQDQPAWDADIKRLERILRDETKRRIREYEKTLREQ